MRPTECCEFELFGKNPTSGRPTIAECRPILNYLDDSGNSAVSEPMSATKSASESCQADNDANSLHRDRLESMVSDCRTVI